MTSRMILVTALAAGCMTRPAPQFAIAPAVTAVDDRRDVPDQPAERAFYADLYNFDGTFHRRVTRAFEVPRSRRALGTNALDEVPDSTWFTNRIGIRTLTPDEIRTGPLHHDSPEHHRPWTIRSTKIGGTSLGLIIKDTRGDKYLVKFDMRGFPETETASHVIVNRLLWACGYNVPEDQIVAFSPHDLVLPPDAKVVDRNGDSHHFTRAELDRQLALVEHLPGGRIRALASRWLDGKPLGGHPDEGVRDDDPNDRIPHELRRDLRGAYALFAWLDHVDVKEANFLDMWTTDPADKARHYVVHYLVDFGRSLGAGAAFGSNLRAGFSYIFDFADMGVSLMTFGIADRPWEHRRPPNLRGIGVFEADTYAPAAWKPAYPDYTPLLVADRFDKFWAAKLAIRFTRAQLHAAVEAGRLSDPRAVEYLTDVLAARQRATARYWFERVAPLDHFDIDDNRIAFDDLALVYGLAPQTHTRYRVTTFARDGRALGPAHVVEADPRGPQSTAALVLAPDPDGYTIVMIETVRTTAAGKPIFDGETSIHVAREIRSRTPRIVGVVRS